ncbi:hypothetical protein EAI_16085 [Harpegnathos saltator]|uniref:Uncharacterized protein n=1 Tax=Harpegnathos saltator TaxID=610380 RepID=E2B2H6_HARSA|nr:hypothetical protein EAI_16085 [Harpegnathos saltator]
MTVCILANDFILGERQAGDYSVTNKITIFKPPIPIIPMRARIGIKCLLNETITYVQISSINGKDVRFYQILGDVGMTSLMVMAMGNPGEGLWLKVEGYCIDLNSVTTEAPTTTTTAPVQLFRTSEGILEVTCPPNETITYVKISNKLQRDVTIQLLEGDVGTPSLLVLATGQKGAGLIVYVEAYCA